MIQFSNVLKQLFSFFNFLGRARLRGFGNTAMQMTPCCFLGTDSECQSRSQNVACTYLLNTSFIRFVAFMQTYRVLAGSAPSYRDDLFRAHVTARTAHERHLAKPSVRHLRGNGLSGLSERGRPSPSSKSSWRWSSSESTCSNSTSLSPPISPLLFFIALQSLSFALLC